MIKYGFKEFVRNIYSNIFIAVQLAVSFLIAAAAVSSVLSRTEMYTPVKEFFSDSIGFFICDVTDSPKLDAELENLEEISEVIGGYDTSLYFSPSSPDLSQGLSDDRKSVNALSDDYINAYSPEMKSGMWLSQAKAQNGKIPAVITENDSYKTGDTITVAHKQVVREMSPDEENYDPDNPYLYEYVENKVEIVGVVADKASLLGFSENDFLLTSTNQNNSPDFRDLYTTVNRYENIMMVVPKSEIENTGCKIYYDGDLIITLKDDVSEQRYQELEFYLRDFGRVFRLDEFRKNSMIYINGQLVKLVPMLICIIILVVVSSVSASALSVKNRLRDYGIFYICGSGWTSCILIGLVGNILTTVLGAVLAVCATNIMTARGVLENTVIEFGKPHFLCCLLIAALNIVISLIIPLIIMKRNTPKDILTNNE